MMKELLEKFEVFSPGGREGIRVFFAPGRVNLIGEHTDYNGGYVLPAALELGTWAFVRPRNDRVFRFASTFAPLVVTTNGDDIRYVPEDDYANYPKGVIQVMQKRGITVPGFDIFFHGNLPTGAGLSSSASVEVVTATAVNALSESGMTPEQLSLLSQEAENKFVGVNSGIMDQFAVGLGKRNRAISLNCATLAYNLIQIQAEGYELIITNTNKRRALTESKYNERRSECEEALRILQRVRPELQYLADISPDEWPSLEKHLENPILHKRARHVVFENHRAIHAGDVLSAGDVKQFGQMMNESHISLRDDYEVTGSELDALAEAAWSVEGCLGSRMTGAGFGGCTVSLVAKDKRNEFHLKVGQQYTAKTGLTPSFYFTEIGDGACEVTKEVFA